MKFMTILTASCLMLATVAWAADAPSAGEKITIVGDKNATPPAGEKIAGSPAGEQSPLIVGSYGIGFSAAAGLKNTGITLDVESLVQGLRDGFQGTRPKYTNEQLQVAVDYLQREAESKQLEAFNAMAEKNLKAGAAFLEANKARKGVVTLPSGLQYEILREGKGAIPRASDTVRVHYEGTLIDGTIFDSSRKRGEPAEFKVGGVIKGWVEALQLMKVGDHWKIFIPAGLAYGSRGTGGIIGPNAVLIFDVELLDILPPADKDKDAGKAK